MPRITATRTGDDSRGRPIWAPLVKVTIRQGPLSTSGLAVLDSGADVTIVPFDIVAPFGISWADLPPAGMGIGAGGGFERRLFQAEVFYESWLACDSLEVSEPGKLNMALLGRDFFAKFAVRFNWHTNAPTFDLDPIARTTRRRK